MTFGAWGWFEPPLPLGNTRGVSHLPSRFTKVSLAGQCTAQFLPKDHKYCFSYIKNTSLCLYNKTSDTQLMGSSPRDAVERTMAALRAGGEEEHRAPGPELPGSGSALLLVKPPHTPQTCSPAWPGPPSTPLVADSLVQWDLWMETSQKGKARML